METRQPKVDGLAFEQAFARLEEVVQNLEGEDLSLEESLALYEQGIALARHCQELLDQAELRVTQLLEEAGEVREVPFAEEAAAP